MLNLKNIILVLIITLFTACTSNNTTGKSRAELKEEAKNTITYLALGDSYTIGEMVSQPETFPFQLARAIEEKTKRKVATPVVIAKTGWRTDELLVAIKSVKEKFNLISLLIGVNNQFQAKDINVFREEFTQLIEQAISFSKTGNKGVFVYSIPDYSVMPFMRGEDNSKVRTELKNYNAICLDICKQLNVSFYDITPISRKAKTDFSLIADDKLHPSAAMYEMWVNQTVYQIISKQLN